VRRFEGRTVLVTGGARGQGRSHSVRFAAEGANVVICDVASERIETVPYPVAGEDDLAETVRLVRKVGGEALACRADVRGLDDIEAAVEQGVGRFGAIDVLVANAGICTFGEIAKMTPELWQTTIDVNLTGTFNAIRAAAPQMAERGYGRIIATASMAGRAGWENIGHYAASKWGVIGLVKSVALELAPHGVTANVVCPSSVNTPMMHNDAAYKLFRPDLDAPTLEDVLPAFQSVNVIPVPYAEPNDISDSVLFLASDRARYITGATLAVSAGVNAQNI
jgi:SDR family mycofactocin-dependent oxidoreductase